MGYSHHWDVHGWNTAKWQRVWPLLLEDAQRIIDAVNVPLCGEPNSEDCGENMTPPLLSVRWGIAINGVDDDGHELFEMSRSKTHDYCKTAYKPYDVVVSSILLRAHMLAPECIEISSDGHWNREDEWGPARDLCGRLWPGETITCPLEENEEDDA